MGDAVGGEVVVGGGMGEGVTVKGGRVSVGFVYPVGDEVDAGGTCPVIIGVELGTAVRDGKGRVTVEIIRFAFPEEQPTSKMAKVMEEISHDKILRVSIHPPKPLKKSTIARASSRFTRKQLAVRVFPSWQLYYDPHPLYIKSSL